MFVASIALGGASLRSPKGSLIQYSGRVLRGSADPAFGILAPAQAANLVFVTDS